jgi:hypothetical protein
MSTRNNSKRKSEANKYDIGLRLVHNVDWNDQYSVIAGKLFNATRMSSIFRLFNFIPVEAPEARQINVLRQTACNALFSKFTG